VTWDPANMSSNWTSLDFDLGDQPVNHLVRDAKTGDLYTATDFGVLVLAHGSSHWREAGEGLPTLLTRSSRSFRSSGCCSRGRTVAAPGIYVCHKA